jgi:hypothetical protein
MVNCSAPSDDAPAQRPRRRRPGKSQVGCGSVSSCEDVGEVVVVSGGRRGRGRRPQTEGQGGRGKFVLCVPIQVLKVPVPR